MMQQPLISIAERLAIFYERLAQAPFCRTADEALELLTATLDGVEDEFSGVVKNPNPGLAPDGRMYPPQADFIRILPDGSKIARSRRHEMRLGVNGSLKITLISTQVVEFQKEGVSDD